jgi:hypothetical protein
MPRFIDAEGRYKTISRKLALHSALEGALSAGRPEPTIGKGLCTALNWPARLVETYFFPKDVEAC